MDKFFLLIGTILSGISVAVGAFGAHALKNILTNNGRSDVYETAVRYQFYHSLAILIIGVLLFKSEGNRYFGLAGYAFVAGIIVFSGSLYILSISNVGKWGAVTPIGGLFFIAGWALCMMGVLKM